MDGVCVEHVATDGGSDIGGTCEAKADTEVDRVLFGSGSNTELHIAR